MLRSVFVGAALLLGAGALCCSSSTTVGSEWGAYCTDGIDNDHDGLTDCKDPDCKNSPYCKSSADGGGDGLAPDQRRPDVRPPDGPVVVDQPLPASSFGATCTDIMLGPCPDGKTVCLPGVPTIQGHGFCSYPCVQGDPGACPGVPAGLKASCVFNFNSQWYCAFLCRFGTTDFPCPNGLGCSGSDPNQKYCWPL